MEQLDALCAAPIQLVILGSGESQIENKFHELEDGNKGKICFYYGYNESLAHRIYAASDLFLMPSLFEPCGISQLCSMRYGTLPLVRETGGLKIRLMHTMNMKNQEMDLVLKTTIRMN